MTVRVHVWIKGRVQGVFYRATCAEEAQRRRLAGWVRNLPDGRVEAVFEGPRAEVDDQVDWCRRGPSSAVVESVQIEEETPKGDDTRFRVTH